MHDELNGLKHACFCAGLWPRHIFCLLEKFKPAHFKETIFMLQFQSLKNIGIPLQDFTMQNRLN